MKKLALAIGLSVVFTSQISHALPLSIHNDTNYPLKISGDTSGEIQRKSIKEFELPDRGVELHFSLEFPPYIINKNGNMMARLNFAPESKYGPASYYTSSFQLHSDYRMQLSRQTLTITES